MTFRLFAMTGLVGMLGFACLAADAPLTFPALFGTWKVERMVGAASISGSDRSARAALGTTVTISADLIRTDASSVSCKPRSPTIVEVDTEEKLESDYGIKGRWMNLPKATLRPRLPFLDAGCADGLVLDRDTLLWSVGNGYIYTLKRQPGGVSITSVRPPLRSRGLAR
jgi:hypothetical protein